MSNNELKPTPRTLEAQIEAERIERVLSAIEAAPEMYEGFALEAAQIARQLEHELASRPDSGMRGALEDVTKCLEQAIHVLKKSNLQGPAYNQLGIDFHRAIDRGRAALGAPQEAGAEPSEADQALEWMKAYWADNLGKGDEEWTIADFEGEIEDLREAAALTAHVLAERAAAPLVAPTPPLAKAVAEAAAFFETKHSSDNDREPGGLAFTNAFVRLCRDHGKTLAAALRSGSTATPLAPLNVPKLQAKALLMSMKIVQLQLNLSEYKNEFERGQREALKWLKEEIDAVLEAVANDPGSGSTAKGEGEAT